jgi:hypothetical protein
MAAPPPAARASRLEMGVRFFNQGEFEVALKNLDAAALEGPDAATLEKIHLLRAQVFAARQDFARAEEAFALALEANPEASLDPARVDPTLVKMLDSVRSRLTGTLVVNSTPSGAALTIDHKPVGVSPLTVSLTVGKHHVEATWGQGPSTSSEVQVRPKKELHLQWVQGAIEHVAAPPESLLHERPLKPFGDLRGVVEVPSNSGASATGGLELGGGFDVSYFRVGLWARLFPFFGLVPRFAFVLPIIDQVNVFLEAQLPLWLTGQPTVSLGLGGSGGAEYFPLRWVAVFAQIGGQHLVLTKRNDPTAFIASAGARLRLP